MNKKLFLKIIFFTVYIIMSSIQAGGKGQCLITWKMEYWQSYFLGNQTKFNGFSIRKFVATSFDRSMKIECEM